MKWIIRLICLTLICLITHNALAEKAAEKTRITKNIRLAIPGDPLSCVMDLPDFTLEVHGMYPDGRFYMMATHDTTQLAVSTFLERVNSKTNECQRTLRDKAKINKNQFKRKDIKMSKFGDMQILEYIDQEFQGKKLDQKHMHACMFKDGLYADIHMSKGYFQPDDQKLFTSVLETVRFEDNVKSSLDYFGNGSGYFLKQEYQKAIELYEKALELEKQEQKLSDNLWIVLVDNLGMAYALLGDYKRSKETYAYGLSKQPMYPMFNYNFSCIYAEMDDLENAMKYLKIAFENKDKQVNGEEGMPDPREDQSFQKALKNENFQNFIKSLLETKK